MALTIRNTGDVPARGFALFAPAGKHSNCRYRGTTSFPGRGRDGASQRGSLLTGEVVRYDPGMPTLISHDPVTGITSHL
ncbi:hypothetical protein P8A22_06335 [Streptomyces laculatispora]|uniref:Uncharacterized protein n=1 Tax=Streptomyces laculatispora TaxID=887464 RepID=A0ABY9HYI6_9ACTN|nr:hypothetical protein [Streptomyces laculatispora]WLQ39653.1 hypothetical protein P8A22_06335 [Streptomyces laculatispora]